MDDSVGSTMSNLNQRIMVNLPFGFPPLLEQHRIVAKVDALMALCDALEARLTAAREAQAAFAAAAVHHLDVW
jgi:type I restriction enzyme S subunit